MSDKPSNHQIIDATSSELKDSQLDAAVGGGDFAASPDTDDTERLPGRTKYPNVVLKSGKR